MKARVLIVKDQLDGSDAVRAFLSARGYEVVICDRNAIGRSHLNMSPDAVLADLRELGTEAAKTIDGLRRLGMKPIIGLIDHAYAEMADQISVLGLDQVVFTPCALAELESRIAFAVERARKQQQHRKEVAPIVERRCHERRRSRVDTGRLPFSIDHSENAVVIDGKKVHLTPKEFRLFVVLASDPGRVFSSFELLDRVWPEKSHAGENDVQQYIRLLRKKIEQDCAHPRLIRTAKGFGYWINGSLAAKET